VTHDQDGCSICATVAREGWSGNGALHCDECGATWTGASKAHCATCHRTFGGSGTADRAHRYPATGIVCLDPATRGLTLDGEIWRRPAPPQGVGR